MNLGVLLITCVFICAYYITLGLICYLPAKPVLSKPNRIKLKVAVHLTGIQRGKKSLDSIYKFIINPLNADLFVDSQIPIPGAKININSQLENKRSNNILPMLYRMFKLQEAFDQYILANKIEYDVVIRIRPDLILKAYIDDKFYLAAQNGVFISIPRYPVYLRFGKLESTDTFFMSNVKVMREINNSFVSMNKYITNHIMGEDIITQAIEILQLTVEYLLDLEYVLENHSLEKIKIFNLAYTKLKAHLLEP